MTEKQLKSGLRQGHRWVGLVATVLLLVAGVTGFLLQHPGWLGPAANPTLAVAADPLQHGRLLRGNHWGVEESVDGGETWAEIPMLAPPTDVVRIVFSPGEPLEVHALGRQALVRSRDGGRVWRDIQVAAPDLTLGVVFRDLAVGATGYLNLLTDRGLLVSTDMGLTWAWAGAPEQEGSPWRRLIHDLHTGQVAGAAGRRVVEFGALALLFLTGTGVVLFRRAAKMARR